MSTTFDNLRREAARRPITCPFKRWTAWAAGAISHYHPAAVRCPLHPDLAREYHNGSAAAASGYVVVDDLNYSLALMRHVEGGQPPHTFRQTRA